MTHAKVPRRKPRSRADKDWKRLKALGWRPIVRTKTVGYLGYLPVLECDGIEWRHPRCAYSWPTQDALALEAERASGDPMSLSILGRLAEHPEMTETPV